MNYQNIYDQLIEKYGTWKKPVGVYTERHRKLPGCLGGKYVFGNAFYVPARIHLLLHLILVKLYPGNEKILHAAFRMSNMWRYGTKEYAWVKEKALPVFVKQGLESKSNESGFHSYEVRLAGSRAGGKSTKERKVGIFAPENIGLGGKTGGKIGGKISGENHAINKTGICQPGISEKAGKIGGKKCADLKLGAHARTPEQMKLDGSKGGKTTGSMPWWYHPSTLDVTRSKYQPEDYLPGRKPKSNKEK